MRPSQINRVTFQERCLALLCPWGVLSGDSYSTMKLLPILAKEGFEIELSVGLDEGKFRKSMLDLSLLALSREFGLRVVEFSIFLPQSAAACIRFREGEPGHIDDIAAILRATIEVEGMLPANLREALAEIPATNPQWWTYRVKALQGLTWRVLTLNQAAFLVKKSFPYLCAEYKTPPNPPGGLSEWYTACKADPASKHNGVSYAAPNGTPAVIETVVQGSNMILDDGFQPHMPMPGFEIEQQSPNYPPMNYIDPPTGYYVDETVIAKLMEQYKLSGQ